MITDTKNQLKDVQDKERMQGRRNPRGLLVSDLWHGVKDLAGEKANK